MAEVIITRQSIWLYYCYRLRKAKEIVPDGEHLRIEQEGSTMTLTVTNITLKDAGLYVCVLENSAGTCKCSAELLVEGEGRIVVTVDADTRYRGLEVCGRRSCSIVMQCGCRS